MLLSAFGHFRRWVGVAALRNLGVASVPEELQTERLSCAFYVGKPITC